MSAIFTPASTAPFQVFFNHLYWRLLFIQLCFHQDFRERAREREREREREGEGGREGGREGERCAHTYTYIYICVHIFACSKLAQNTGSQSLEPSMRLIDHSDPKLRRDKGLKLLEPKLLKLGCSLLYAE